MRRLGGRAAASAGGQYGRREFADAGGERQARSPLFRCWARWAETGVGAALAGGAPPARGCPGAGLWEEAPGWRRGPGQRRGPCRPRAYFPGGRPGGRQPRAGACRVPELGRPEVRAGPRARGRSDALAQGRVPVLLGPGLGPEGCDLERLRQTCRYYHPKTHIGEKQCRDVLNRGMVGVKGFLNLFT